jgi:hypothetical protein
METFSIGDLIEFFDTSLNTGGTDLDRIVLLRRDSAIERCNEIHFMGEMQAMMRKHNGVVPYDESVKLWTGNMERLLRLG